MYLLNDPEYLRNCDVFKYSNPNPTPQNFGVYNAIVNYKISNYTNNYRYKIDFSQTTNKYLVLIEYLEKNVMTLTTFGMPSIIYSYPEPLLKQENNLFNSFIKLKKKKKKKKKKNVFIVTLSRNNTCFINKVDYYYTSGHIQPKIETQLTFLKQEILSFEKKKKKNKNKKKKKKKKKGEKKKEKEKDMYFSSIKNWRIIHIYDELDKWNYFFEYLSEYDPNELIIMLYTLSCFPIHNIKMQNILTKITNFFSFTLNWSNSINYGWSQNSNNIGKSYFHLKFQRIFKKYFTEGELYNFNVRLKNYILDESKKNKYKFSSVYEKNMIWSNTKIDIINNIYQIEAHYIDQPQNISETFKRYFNRKYTKEYEEIDDVDMMIELITNDETEPKFDNFNYDDMRFVKKSELFKFLSTNKMERNESKKSKKATKSTQIRYSKLFFKKSPYVLDIHPTILKNFSNPYSVFKDFDSNSDSDFNSTKRKRSGSGNNNSAQKKRKHKHKHKKRLTTIQNLNKKKQLIFSYKNSIKIDN